MLTNNKVFLEWSTETEMGNYGFNVERSIAIDDWHKIGFVPGSGNSSSTINYSFIDEDIPNSSVLCYRLKQIDNDGSYEYSDEVLVHNPAPIEYDLFQNYPNPFNPVTVINYSLPLTSQVDLVVYNTLGESVTQLVYEEKEAGKYSVEFYASGLPSGLYFYQLKARAYVEIKKMMLLK
jgi:hypothetical protein